MEAIDIQGLSFAYPNQTKPALDNIYLSVGEGEFVVLCGKSGSGKSTFLRHFKPMLAPHGMKSGTVTIFNRPIDELTAKEQSERIGFIFQNPEDQIVTDEVWHELAFGLENLGWPKERIRARVAEMASFFGMESWFHKKTTALSGGQKQLLNLASVMVMRPSILVLDEPTAQLDPIAAQEFFGLLSKINRELGTTILLSEHRLHEAFSYADKVIVLEDGRLFTKGTPESVGRVLFEQKNGMFAALPVPMKLHFMSKKSPFCPLSVCDGRRWLREFTSELRQPEFAPVEMKDKTKPAVELKNIRFRYERDSEDVLCGLSLSVRRGECYALVGGNAAGKSTALSVICGLRKPTQGKVNIGGNVSMLPQNPQVLFAHPSVREELEEMRASKEKLEEVIALCALETLLTMHPYDLSGGEQERLALAKVLLSEPDILLLDEPTKGMDAEFKLNFADILIKLKEKGMTILLVSHDVEFCARYADRCGMLFDGTISGEGNTREFFSGNSFYTTEASRIAGDLIPKAVLLEDILFAIGEQPMEWIKKEPEEKKKEDKTEKPNLEVKQGKKQKKRNEKHLFQILLAIIFLLITAPTTLFFGMNFSGGKNYYLISLLILVEVFIPFVFLFEQRRPKARELVLVGVLCALCVVSRTAFYMIPQFKPMLALVILCGALLGAETGFLIGAIAAFVSNFFFGQGPWTPWQMFATGLVGFLSGVVFYSGKLPKKKLWLCVFGALSTWIVYGGIMNSASVLMWQANPNFEMLWAAMFLGFPMDMVHTASTVIFLCILSKPIIYQIERIREKYGM